MSSKRNIPQKGDIVINPNTSRPIRVGSRTWLNLVKKGVIQGHYRDDHELAEMPDHEYEVNDRITKINKTLPRGKQAVRGRGKHKGKIVSRQTRLKSNEISAYTAKIASRVVSDNIDELVESGDNINETLEQLILKEMLQEESKMNKPQKRKSNKQHSQWSTEEVQEYDEFSGESNDEFDECNIDYYE